MKRVYLSVCSLLPAGAVLLLDWLGFSGCSKTPNAGITEYGTPTVDYEFRVCVTDQDAKPVEGLQVDLLGSYGDEKELTDAQGNTEIGGGYMNFHRGHQVVLEMEDIDGEKNGVVADKQVTVEVKESDFVSRGSKKWNSGRVKKAIEIQVERR